jgi:Undecaprenyl-phosphate galactose phosphotransferase WbaP
MDAVISAREPEVTPSSRSRLRTTYWQRHARAWMAGLLLLTDVLSLLAASFAAFGVRYWMGDLVNPPFYWSLVPLVLVFPAIYALQRLYPAVGLSPVEELRRLTLTTSAVFLFITAFTFWVRTAEYYSRLIFAFAWVLSLVTAPGGRWLMRSLAVKLGVWGEPVAIVGCGGQAQRIERFLRQRSHLGLRPVAYIGSTAMPCEAGLSLPSFIFGEEADLDTTLRNAGVHTAILVTSELPTELQDAIVNEQYFKFRHLILISNLNWVGSVGIDPHDLEGYLGLEVRQNLLNDWQQLAKRLLDISLSSLGGLVALPFLLVIALLIRLDSPGKALYGHSRLGRGGRPITVWKFRTMVANADQILEAYLSQNPGSLSEWKANYKIKDDPRITRCGRFLRKFSLDELPQLWNVLKGEMSLVGPRPIVTSEVKYYQQGYALYKRVRPGLTGMWQVSGRTDVSYDERVRLDEYYVRNWSLWLDIYIIVRTVWVVLQGKGAY